VRINDRETKDPHFTTEAIGKEKAIARDGIHGLHWLFSGCTWQYTSQWKQYNLSETVERQNPLERTH
ncbi:unnamed protein product, partial [Ilex paraguariensis]